MVNPSPTNRDYFDLKALATYSSCSVRWLRGRLVDPVHPLPYHRIGGKILVKREDFERWISRYKSIPQVNDLDSIVDDVLVQMTS